MGVDCSCFSFLSAMYWALWNPGAGDCGTCIEKGHVAQQWEGRKGFKNSTSASTVAFVIFHYWHLIGDYGSVAFCSPMSQDFQHPFFWNLRAIVKEISVSKRITFCHMILPESKCKCYRIRPTVSCRKLFSNRNCTSDCI